ncbi:cytochrome c biogenesis protein CcdA, partial [Candidatus Woesearchaeota archaeon]|nr:cytochrome c biogenesis protein CcdA [Candidatus Woesearchaeota archaeon]
FVKSAQVIKESNLVADYLGRSSEVSLLEKRGKENFFLPGLLEAQKAGKPLPSASFVAPSLEDRQFTDANFAALALLAFLVGLVSFLSPCTLPILPAFFASAVESGRAAHTSGVNPSKHKKIGIAANALLFAAGLGVVFAVFGMGAALFGSVLREHRVLFSAAAGVVVIVLGLLQILGKGFSGFRLFSGKAPGRAGFVFFGMAFGLGWSACIGPVLASLLLLAASSSTVIKGMLLLLIYISGLALPLLLLSLAFERIKNQKLWQLLNGSPITITIFNKRIETHTTYILSGFLLIIIGFLIFNGYLYSLNKFALSTGYVQKIVIGAEEWLKSVLV